MVQQHHWGLLVVVVVAPASALDNGLALTPPQGWRS
eukprot:SAG11_NODE_20538_length_443_cov_1.046512_1_plen_35_part_01